MADWSPPPGFQGGDLLAVNPFGKASLGAFGTVLGTGLGGLAWPTANKALFVPVRFSRPARISRVFWQNASVLGGNVDWGLYDRNGNRIVSTGSTAQAGGSTLQVVTLGSAAAVAAGLYYMALALDNTTGTISRSIAAQFALQLCGMAEMASAFPLPATVTLASMSSTYLPSFGLFLRGTP